MVAEKLGKSTAQVTLRWGLQMGHSVLPKSVNEARIKENFDIFDWSIPDDLFVCLSEIKQACIISSLSLLMFCAYEFFCGVASIIVVGEICLMAFIMSL